MMQKLFIPVGILFACGSAVAGWFGADFSADIYQLQGQQEQKVGRMFVGEGRVRTEIGSTEQGMVEIIDPHRGTAWLLDRAHKRYRQRPVPDAKAAADENPCAAMPQASCSRLGVEAVNGRRSVKWQITQGGRTMLHWFDMQHHFPVRVVEGGELQMEMRYVEERTYEGRTVELWQSWATGPRGENRATQWYDPQLNIAVRQQTDDGRWQELRNIRLGKQPVELFQLPEGYTRAEIPTGRPPQTGEGR